MRESFLSLIIKEGDKVVAKITYKYDGSSRPEKKGIEKKFEEKDLDPKKLERLKARGWKVVVKKPKPKKTKKGAK
tara:strand:+ start:468 stop:692 length:225 start_codon:yes stop_codon:yes gene_type:complete